MLMSYSVPLFSLNPVFMFSRHFRAVDLLRQLRFFRVTFWTLLPLCPIGLITFTCLSFPSCFQSPNSPCSINSPVSAPCFCEILLLFSALDDSQTPALCIFFGQFWTLCFKLNKSSLLLHLNFTVIQLVISYGTKPRLKCAYFYITSGFKLQTAPVENNGLLQFMLIVLNFLLEYVMLLLRLH